MRHPSDPEQQFTFVPQVTPLDLTVTPQPTVPVPLQRQASPIPLAPETVETPAPPLSISGGDSAVGYDFVEGADVPTWRIWFEGEAIIVTANDPAAGTLINAFQLEAAERANGVVLLLSLMLGFEALNPHSETAPIVRVVLLVVIAFLIVGVLPGSYLQRRIQGASQTEAVRRSRLLRIVSLAGPIILLVPSSLLAYSQYSTLSFIDNTYLSGLDRGEVMFNIIRFWTQSGASLVWLVLIAAALVKKEPQDQQTS